MFQWLALGIGRLTACVSMSTETKERAHDQKKKNVY